VNICVCGWYGREFDEFYMTLWKAQKNHKVYVMAKREDTFWKEMDLPHSIIPNTGLEWKAYDSYLYNAWKGGDILFTHDDVRLLPIIQNNATVATERIFDELAQQINYDQAYMFRTRAEDVFCNGQHGRLLFISNALAKWLRDEEDGIWSDANNFGYTGGKKPEGPVKHYNAGTEAFYAQMVRAKKAGFNVLNKVYVPAWRSGHRGKIKDWEELL
jgi:hypothetical protein